MHKLKYFFIQTALEEPLFRIREALDYLERWRHPELGEVYMERRRIRALLARTLQTTTSCIDVGAHYGSVLSRFCRLAPKGNHLAVEAIGSKVRFLRRRFPGVDIRETAVADFCGTTTFFVNCTATGFSGLSRRGAGERFKELAVPCSTLDVLVGEDRSFGFLKVDVEGAELLVFRGATRLLLRDRPTILFECTPARPNSTDPEPVEVFEFLTTQMGYSILFLKDALRGGMPVDRSTFQAALQYPFQAFNWVAFPTERMPG